MGRQSTSAAVPVLVTRPEPEATITAGTLSARFAGGVRPVVTPLMAVEFLKPRLPDGPFGGVIFTSSAAVVAAGRLPVDFPRQAWCVGRSTTARAAEAGFAAISADGDADALVASILDARPSGRLLHLRGEESRGNVAERLTSAGIETVSAVIYRQVPQPLSAEATELLRETGVVVVPLFSPRSAGLLAQALPVDRGADLRLVCMSEAVARVAAGIGGTVTIADHPDLRAMLDAVSRALT